VATPIRRLDHVAIAVRSTDVALEHFRDRLGLKVVHSEEVPQPHVRLTYLDVGNAFIQLVEPLDIESDLARSLAEDGEGVHHVCFGVDDALAGAAALSTDGAKAVLGTGRGRLSAFVPGEVVHNVRIECTEFDRAVDVDDTPGWLENGSVEPA
jgi:methylmalonyl-CoA/ethylmalonyl-CoA epimerase